MSTIELPPDARSPRKARRFVRTVLEDAGIGGVTVEDAELLVTELVTNAVVHAGTRLLVEVATDGDRVRIAVADRSDHLPEKRPITARSIAARGLHIVHALAESWTVQPRDDGKMVEVVLSVARDQ